MFATPLLIYNAFAHTFLLSAGILSLAILWTNARPSLELAETDAIVRVYRSRRIPWSAITGVRPASLRRGGGVLLQTAWGEQVRAPAPSSWWGGPASDAQVAEIERWWLDHRGNDAVAGRPDVLDHRPQ